MDFRYFKIEDFACSETGLNEIRYDFVSALDDLRGVCGFPFIITSGYRSPCHSSEAAKVSPGQHAQGTAADIKVTGGAQRYAIVNNAIRLGFKGIGVAKNFVHVDRRDTEPMLWRYR
jgi:zinc D-Ala-D-Ala carboxypeptidase